MGALCATGCSEPASLHASQLEIDPIAAGSEPEAAAVAADLDIAWLPASVRRHAALLHAAGARHGVDPEVLAIVTLVESGGWVHAKSPSGARGLMQLMPATAAVIAERRAISGHARDKLYDPAYNLDFGAWYLAQQLEEFGGDDRDASLELAAAAYNGGPGTLRRHLEGQGVLSAQTQRYKYWVRSMWADRRRHASETFDSWRQSGGQRLLDRAQAEQDR